MSSPSIRQANPDDYEAVASFTEDTWAEHGRDDYIPDVFDAWVDSDGPDQRTVVVDVGDDIAGLCQGTLLSEHEAWVQGMRVAPGYRGEGHGHQMVEHLFTWARERGATVARNMVFGWNDAGLGQSLTAGFEPRTSFRWARPDPSAEQDIDATFTVDDDPSAAWSYWARSEARDSLGGLALDSNHSWTLSELTRDGLHALADAERVFAVKADGMRAMAARVRTTDQTGEDDVDSLAEYAVGAWEDADAAETLFTAIRADARDLGVDATRVLIPESPRHVATAAAARAGVSDYADYVFEADLTGR